MIHFKRWILMHKCIIIFPENWQNLGMLIRKQLEEKKYKRWMATRKYRKQKEKVKYRRFHKYIGIIGNIEALRALYISFRF